MPRDIYTVIEEQNLPDQLGTYRHIQFTNEGDVDVHAVTLTDTYHARLYQQKSQTQAFAKTLKELSEEENFVLGINGGYYTEDFKPDGLFMERKKILRPFSRERMLSACIRINMTGKVTLIPKNSECCFKASAYSAMQTGPWIIRNGAINPIIERSQSHLAKIQRFYGPHRRTVLAESNDKKMIVIITSSASLLQLANILKNYPQAFHIKKIITAINLDGGSSTAMYIKFDKQPFYASEFKRVKTFVFFN